MSQTKRIHEQKELNKNTLQQRIQILEKKVEQILSVLRRSTD